jgi:hypothetical protein
MQARITQIKKVMFLEDDWEKKNVVLGYFRGRAFPFRYFSAREKDSYIGKHSGKNRVKPSGKHLRGKSKNL